MRRRSCSLISSFGGSGAAGAPGVGTTIACVGGLAFDLVEVGDRLLDAVLEDLEVVLRQAGDGVALLVGDDDVDADDADVDVLGQLRRLGAADSSAVRREGRR